MFRYSNIVGVPLLLCGLVVAGHSQITTVQSINSTLQAQEPVRATITPATGEQLQDLRIGKGDLLHITMLGMQDTSADARSLSSGDNSLDLRVSSSGDISFPPLGLVRVMGLTTAEAERFIERQLVERGYYREPQISIFQKEYASQGVSVLGEVKTPGVYPVYADRHLLDVLSQAGGLTPTAGRSVTVFRAGDPKPMIVTLTKDPAQNADSNILVSPGDTIMVSTAGIVYVVGNVNKPGGFVLADGDITSLQALALAGGQSPLAALNSAQIIRQVNGTREQIPIALNKILEGREKDVTLHAQDILFVPNSKAKDAASRTIQAIMQAAVGVAIYRRP